MRQQPPLGSRTWKPEEEDYLMEKWGQISVPAIAKKLNRTTNAVKVRAQRLGLGDGKSEGYFRSYWNSYPMEHEENEKLDRIYALLVKLGYEMSDDEKALQDGTHALFGEATDE